MKDTTDDFDLVRKILKGETGYFPNLVEKYENRVYKTCYRFVRNPEDALDLSQEVFIRIYNNLSAFHGFSTLSTWIYKISVNTCLNFIRKKDLLVLDAENCDTSYPAHVSPEKHIELKELYELLDLNLEKSGQKSKSIFSYRLFHGMPFKEIAGKLKISPESARMNYSRTRKSLKKSIREYQKGE